MIWAIGTIYLLIGAFWAYQVRKVSIRDNHDITEAARILASLMAIPLWPVGIAVGLIIVCKCGPPR